MHASFTVLFASSPGAVFDYLGNPALRPQWQASLDGIDDLSSAEPACGVTWQESPRGGPRFEMEIVAFDRPLRWGERFAAKGVHGMLMLDLRADASSTRVTLTLDVTLQGWRRVASPLVRWILPRLMKRDLERADQRLRAMASPPMP